ncbi:MAG: glutamyl-tRNA amidotransferase [SAR86 cluster bacterium BACL1 MAG-120920-bin57]|uniref:Glutamyl-tRNA amidotransferase n=2 Tax=SAR86 cluster TaxID=62672 RepID=A0A0R2UA16_9GAMM|nr:MAG: glutamyl-tRNA amidotransferase [SAR86 cluster bacterium BACL1 MAG-120507-bin14]KRO40166.1 MAG: glutamyl-tRNA amidotransferase [SAR86 cluster bacterium BACL1 MAG-120920-bin57]KRO96369.1 MAG: glutamyl-tRNA amidotransferase [SAR86 cluster bacterium BACL1 MAG-120820-bin45]KRO97660.1 MAG: glutamyl-tRNA amidotransferase [SAR86 cluster bacterium BACL1 MAG-120828-bin5]KRO99541.1 MAG: glutamyl-tRNA amidotransferase [SAR86 cluster bacterium BACL1 MAG-120823-bin87]KRP00530.1 MAG: glutamyl-tRNA am
MSLLDTINQDLKTAMISKEVVARDTIRMLLSEIKKYEIDEREEATDPIILALINKNVKQRRDSIEQFKNGGRADLVTKEEEQLKVILQYLPQQLSVDEIKAIVQQGIDEISAQTMQDMGKLMALLKPQLEGKADMSVVSAAVKELLN